jgi:hypothetical protein
MAITQQAVKLRPNEAYNGGSSGLRTCWYKFEFDAPFDQVQHLVGSKVVSGTPGTYKVQFAVTDAIAVDTVNNAWVPMRAGVAYNDKSANGWKDATFAGAVTKQIGLAPNVGNNNGCIHMSTDVMDLASVPRADGKPGGILLVKVVQIDSAGGYTQGSSNSSAWDSARGVQPWFREWFCNAQSNVDGIANLATLPSGTPFNGDYAFPGTPIVTSTATSVPMELLLFTGDSRKSSAFMNNRFANPARMAAMSLSTPARPISTVNAAGSGHTQANYLLLAMDQLNAGVRPTVIHLPGFSQNGFSSFANFKTANDNFMASVRAMPGLSNVKFVLDTDYYVGGYGGSTEAARQQCIAYAKSLANGTTVFCFDSDAIITDYTNPSALTFKSAYFTSPNFTGGDGVHAGPTGLDAMTYGDGTTPGLQSVYRTAFGLDAPVADTTAPVMVGAITVSAITSSGFTLACDAATDAVGVAGYEYSIDGGTNYVAIANAARTVVVTGRSASTSHPVRMRAFDAAGNRATPLSATATTTAAADTTAPVMTGEITVSAITTSGATLSCPAATDAVGVAGYEYSINGGTNYTVIANAARSVVVSGRPASTAHAVRMRAFDAAGNRATPLSASFTTLAEQPAQNAVVASAIAESRRVAFPGGTRVVAFGSVPGARTPNAPYLEGGKWWSEKHPLDERYWVANLTIDLAERGTTAVSVEAIVAGVTVLQQPVIQGKLIPVKLGGFNAATGAVNFCTFRVTCANGERFDRTIWFKQQVGSWSLEKDADDESYFVADISNDLADSNTTASAVLAQPVSVLVPAVIQGSLILVKLGGMDTLPAGVNYCDLRIDCANSERFYRTIQFNRVDN